jgi:hypothetical protein
MQREIPSPSRGEGQGGGENGISHTFGVERGFYFLRKDEESINAQKFRHGIFGLRIF